MKKFNFLSLSFVLLSLFSCRDDRNNSTPKSIDNLEAVKFSDLPPKILSSKKTGHTRYNPSTSSTEYEYLNVIEKTHTLSPLSFVDSKNTDVIYPGSILRGESFMKGSYDPLIPKVGFNDVIISMSLRGKDLPIKASAKPQLSEVRNVTNTLLAKYKNEIDYSFVPAYVSYQADKVNTSSSFNKSFNLHANINILGGIVSSKFNYQDSYTNSKSNNYIMIKLHQNFYSVSIDPKHYSEWFNGEVNPSDFGTYEPVYVSNVDYGRVAYLLIETNKSEEETKKMVSGAVNFAFGKVSGGVEASYNQSFKKLFSKSKIRILIAGGPAKLAGQVNTYDSFIEFIKTPSIEDLISSAVPISYKIRRLKDNTEVEVKTIISEKELAYKNN